MAGMSRKEIARLLDHVEPQGVTATRTTKGVMLRMPDGETTAMLHFTGSDVREQHNVRARLKRAGVTWPGEDAGPLRAAITERKPHAATLRRAQEALAGWEPRTINASQLIRLTGGEPDWNKIKDLPSAERQRGMTMVTAQRCLYHLGWTPTGKSTNRKWVRPVELDPEPDWPTAQSDAQSDAEGPAELAPPVPLHPEPDEAAQAAQQAQAAQDVVLAPTPLQLVPPPAEPAVRTHPAGHEFIDTVDSWSADLAALPDDYTLGQVRAVLAAFGLQLELRTWRAEQ